VLAMSDLRRFESDVQLETVARAVASHFRSTGFETTGYRHTGGHTIQGKKGGTLRTVAGLASEATVSLLPTDGGFVARVDRGGPASQVLGGAVGYLYFTPLLGLAGYGAYRRHKLSDRVFEAIERALDEEGASKAS
jgi:hypothetical protein